MISGFWGANALDFHLEMIIKNDLTLINDLMNLAQDGIVWMDFLLDLRSVLERSDHDVGLLLDRQSRA